MTTSFRNQTRAKAEQRRARAQAAAIAVQRQQRRQRARNWAVVLIATTLVLGGLYAIFRAGNPPATTTTATADSPRDYAVGSPGPGQRAPDFTLPATTGKDVSLRDFRGRNVLLYFHEGLGCQPCWDQIRDLERESARLKAAGIDEFVSITSAPPDILAQKMRDDGLRSAALADPGLAVISAYEANKYGMMGDSRAGHSFILVNDVGEIVWRADYGGAPDYTMYVPVDKILSDLEASRSAA